MGTRIISDGADNNVTIASKTYRPINFTSLPGPWVRNPTWPAVTVTAGSNRMVGLYAVYPGTSNFIAVNCAGAYTVNYGDGTTTNYATGVQANYVYDYADAELAGTDGPVTFTDSTNTVNRTAHGYTDGMVVQFYNIVSTTGITAAQYYYVINATANTFQISSTVGGSAINLVTNGSATLLPYKIATVTITPQGGSNLTSIDLYVKHNQAGLTSGYSTGWLDISIASLFLTTLQISIASPITVKHLYLEQVKLIELGAITTFLSLFSGCTQLQSVVISTSTSGVNSTSSMFANCRSLVSLPLFNTAAVNNMSSMFINCSSLTTVPLFNTAAVNNMSSMFSGCRSLISVPLFNTALVNTMEAIFLNCQSLTSVPLFNTALVTNLSEMLSGCRSLTTVPLFNTAAVTDMTMMFIDCSNLESVPLFNTGAVDSLVNTFNGCSRLRSVPLFNLKSTGTVNLTGIFSNCSSLVEVPPLNMVAVTSFISSFSNCTSLKTIPPFTTTATLLAAANMFENSVSLTSVPLFNTQSVTNMNAMFRNCTSLVSVPLFNLAACSNMQEVFNGCNALKSVPALTFTSSPNNFSNIFLNCKSLIRMEARQFFFNFSVANCNLSATALNEIYTNLPTVAAKTITVTGNWGTATDNPAIATAKNWTVTG